MKLKFFALEMPIVLAFAVFLLSATRLLFFYLSPDSVLIGVIPDDAFYYIQMAAHRARSGLWTFDGHAPATGFHVLYGYILLCVFKIFPQVSWHTLYLAVGGISCLSISAAVYLLTKTATEVFGRPAAIAAVLPFLTFPMILQGALMMESWLVILFSSLTLYLVSTSKPISFWHLSALVLTGLLGSLARSDYGMLPGALVCAAILMGRFKIGPVAAKSLVILFGALWGLAVVLTLNYLTSGQLSQASAQTKLFWSSVAGHSTSAPLRLILSTLLPVQDISGRHSRWIWVGLAVLVTYCLVKLIRRSSDENKSTSAGVLLSCVLTIVGYIIFYRFNSEALQVWYSANIVAPLAIISAAICRISLGRCARVAGIALCAVYLSFAVKKLFFVPWPHHAGMMNAGLHIRAFDREVRFAAWNAGIISYFSGGSVVNIDGLTNDEILPYIKANKLIDYLKQRKINYIADYREMVDSSHLRLRGGYNDERVYRCLVPIRSIDGGAARWVGSELILFKINVDCL